MCYNKYRKRDREPENREVLKMDTRKFYRNETTMETTDTHAIAMAWYRDGAEVSIWTPDKDGDFQKRCYWAH